MPQYNHIIERFKRYNSWTAQIQNETEYTFQPVWSSSRKVFYLSALLALIGMFALTYVAINTIPSPNQVLRISLEEYGRLVQDHRKNGTFLTGSPCDNGIIGEVADGRTYWVSLDYSGRRWVLSHRLQPSQRADTCTPPFVLQSQRLGLVLLGNLALSIAFLGINYRAMHARWGKLGQVRVHTHDGKVIITHSGGELIPTTYEQIDREFDLPAYHITLPRIYLFTTVLCIIGIVLSYYAALR